MQNKYDAFYIVVDTAAQRLKFGVTSGDGSQRIKQHASYGFLKTELLFVGYPSAYALESFLKKSLKLLDIEALFGHECFHASALETIFHLVNAFQSKGYKEFSSESAQPIDEHSDRIIMDIRAIWPTDMRYVPGYELAALLKDYDPYWHTELSADDTTAARRLAYRLKRYAIESATHRVHGVPKQSYAKEDFMS